MHCIPASMCKMFILCMISVVCKVACGNNLALLMLHIATKDAEKAGTEQ